MKEFWTTLEASLPDLLWRLASIICILIATRLLVKAACSIINKAYQKRAQRLPEDGHRRMDTTSTLAQSIAKYVIWFFGLCAIIGQLGLTATMTSLLATAGIGGVALGIGAQSFVKDVVAGFFLLFEDQMRVGDYVTIAGVTGTVEEVALRNTTLKGFRGELNVIPNGSIDVLVNYSRADYLALVDIPIAYEADAKTAMALMLEEAEAYAKENDNTKEAPEVLGVNAMEKEGLTLRLILKVAPLTHWQTERALMERITARFRQEGIELPYPRLVVLDNQRKDGRA